MPEHYIRKVILALEALRQDAAPVPEYEVRKLHGLKDTYRIRLGTSALNTKSHGSRGRSISLLSISEGEHTGSTHRTETERVREFERARDTFTPMLGPTAMTPSA